MADDNNPQNRADVVFGAKIDEPSFQQAEKRAEESVAKTTAATKAGAREAEREARNLRRVSEQSAQEDTAAIKAQQAERTRIQRESASIAKATHTDESRAYKDQIDRERRQLQEAAAIRKSMLADETNNIAKLRKAEADLAADRRQYAREARAALNAGAAQRMESRGRQLYTPDQLRAFEKESGKFLDMLGPVKGGAPPRPPVLPGGRAPGGRGWGGGQGIDPFLTSFGFGLGATGAPGSRLAGTLALGQGFGGREGLYGGIAGGAVAVAAVAAIYSVKKALEDDKAERTFAANILSIGAAYNESRAGAEAFRGTMVASRAEALALGEAFAYAGTKIQTRPGDVSEISTRANATGESAEDLAKTLRAISEGNRAVFETQTGLKAQIVIDEYARSIGKLPSELTKAAEAQALYNKFIQQGSAYQELANARLQSTEGRFTKFKNSVADFAGEFGNALIGTYISGDTPRALAEKEWEATVARDRANRGTGQTDALAEQRRQRELELRYEGVSIAGERGLKALQREKPGETQNERLKALIDFRDEFHRLTKELDEADPRIKAVSEQIEQRFSQSVGKAYNEVEQLRRSVLGMTSDFAALRLPGENNPFVKLYSDAADAAEKAYEKFRLLGPEVVSQYAQMQTAAIQAQVFQVQVQTEMKATSLDFEAARLSKPFIELTGEMKRSLSVLQTEVGAAINVPKLLANATAIDLYARFQSPRANERAFGQFGVSETSDTFVSQQRFDSILKLRRQYAGEGLGGKEAQHILDLELIKLFSNLPPGLQASALRAPGARGPQGFATVFSGAFRGEAKYANEQIDVAVQKAAIGRQAAQEAQVKLGQLEKLGQAPGAQKGALRAEILAITGALPREELTPSLLKGRIDALKEEAVFQRRSQEAAINAVGEAKMLRSMLDQRLAEIQTSIKNREESVLLRVLDDSQQTRVSTLGGAMQ